MVAALACFDEPLPTNNVFMDEDHSFFSIIMEKPFLRKEFGVGVNDLDLEAEQGRPIEVRIRGRRD
jgi:hypothetical protein